MKEWIGIILILSIISYFSKTFLPNKKTYKYLNFLLAIISIVYLINPIESFISGLNGEVNFELGNTDLFQEDDNIEVLQNFRYDYYLSTANSVLQSDNLKIKKAEFVFDDKISGNPLKKIKINYVDIVINQESEHINISLIIKSKLSQAFMLEKEFIEINGIEY